MNKEYCVIFNAVSEAIEALNEVKEKLIVAQIEAEDIYISKEIK